MYLLNCNSRKLLNGALCHCSVSPGQPKGAFITLSASLNPREFPLTHLKHPVPFHRCLHHNQKHISGEDLAHVFMLSWWLFRLYPSIKNTFYLMSQYIHIWLKIKYHVIIPSLTRRDELRYFLLFKLYLFCIQIKI